MLPQIYGVKPANNSIGVALEEVIRITFDQRLDPLTVNPYKVRITDINRNVDISQDCILGLDELSVITISPKDKWKYLTDYKITISEVESFYGEMMFGTYVYEFQTKESLIEQPTDPVTNPSNPNPVIETTQENVTVIDTSGDAVINFSINETEYDIRDVRFKIGQEETSIYTDQIMPTSHTINNTYLSSLEEGQSLIASIIVLYDVDKIEILNFILTYRNPSFQIESILPKNYSVSGSISIRYADNGSNLSLIRPVATDNEIFVLNGFNYESGEEADEFEDPIYMVKDTDIRIFRRTLNIKLTDALANKTLQADTKYYLKVGKVEGFSVSTGLTYEAEGAFHEFRVLYPFYCTTDYIMSDSLFKTAIGDDVDEEDIKRKIYENSKLARTISVEAGSEANFNWDIPSEAVIEYVKRKTVYDLLYNKFVLESSSGTKKQTLDNLSIEYTTSTKEVFSLLNNLASDYLKWESLLRGTKSSRVKPATFKKGENVDTVPAYISSREVKGW